jgi:hypothetical protein
MKRSPYLRTEINSRPKMHIFNRPDHQHAGAQEDSRMMQVRGVIGRAMSSIESAVKLFADELEKYSSDAATP